MANEIKKTFLNELNKRYGHLRKLARSQSLYETPDGAARIYIRYSRVHGGDRTFYGLRQEDLRQLEGYPALLCFLWDDQAQPLLVPFPEYEDVFQSISPARDGQYKAQVYLRSDGTELYIAKAGRFNVEAYLGWDELESLVDSTASQSVPELSHSQIQTLLGAIGVAKGYDIWVPQIDRSRLDWSLTNQFNCNDALPHGFEPVAHVLQEIDVLWIQRGAGDLRALFEVEHSTPIYSGLLRFNDIYLTTHDLHPRFSVVANDVRRSQFARQISRPTFQASGLHDLCTFLDYGDVFRWHHRIIAK